MSEINITYYYIEQNTCWVDIPKNPVTEDSRFNIGEYEVKIAHFSNLDCMMDFLTERAKLGALDLTFSNEHNAVKTALKLNQTLLKDYAEIITNSIDSCC